MLHHVYVPVVGRARSQDRVEVDFDAPDVKPSADAGAAEPPQGGVVGLRFELERGVAFVGSSSLPVNPALRSLRPFVRRVANLFGETHLVAVATAALDAVIAMNLRPNWLRTPYQFFIQRNLWQDHVAVQQQADVGTTFEGASATLGLAVGLLMAGTACRTTEVLATGGLAAGKAPEGKPRGSGTRVVPIDSLGQKMAMVRAWAEHHPRTPGQRIPFFVPLEDENGNAVSGDTFRTAHAETLKALGGLGIDLVAVGTLADVAKELDAHRLATVLPDVALQAVAAVAVGAAVVTAGVGLADWRHRVWRERPIAGGVEFVPYQTTHFGMMETPFRYDPRRSQDRPLELCRNEAAIAGEWLAVNVRLGNGTEAEESYWPSIIEVPQHISATKRPRLHGVENEGCARGPVASGGTWCRAVETCDATKPGCEGDELEDVALIVVADRERDITEELRHELNLVTAAYDPENNQKAVTLPLDEVVSHFQARYPQRTSHKIIRLVDAKECLP